MEAISNVPEKLLYRQVRKIPVIELLKEGNRPPKGRTHAIIEQVSKDILSFCSEDYKLRKNSTIYKPFEKLLERQGIPFEKHIKVVDGNKFYVDYIIKKKLKSSILNDILPKLSIWNSYDGTVKTQIKFGYHKLLCGNGLSRPLGCQIHTSSKHSSDEEEFSSEIIPHFLDLFTTFLEEAPSDIQLFEKLHRKKAHQRDIQVIADKIHMSREAREIALNQLQKETSGGMTYINESGRLMSTKKGPVTLFMIYNAMNYAIHHTNSKELPEFKSKRDKALIHAICSYCEVTKNAKRTESQLV